MFSEQGKTLGGLLDNLDNLRVSASLRMLECLPLNVYDPCQRSISAKIRNKQRHR